MLPTLGGQTGLNLAMALYERGLIGVPDGTPELIGANAEAIATAEDRERFKEAMVEIGLDVPRSGIAHTLDEARTSPAEIGLPVIIRPGYILGGRGTGIAATPEEFDRLAAAGLAASPIGEILIEESIAGWKEFELEVMRDRRRQLRDHLLDRERRPDGRAHRRLDHRRPGPDADRRRVPADARRRVRLHPPGRRGDRRLERAVRPRPATGRQVVIEMNPRVSRSSALASKATGFPIAKIAAKLAVGYTLDEIPNDITQATPASFEPMIDYVVTKVPRWAFEKLPGTTGVLGTQMQSVGEAMAIGRTFPESLQKALRSLEQGRLGPQRRPGRGRARRRSTTTSCWRRSPCRRPSASSSSASCCAAASPRSTCIDLAAPDRPWFLDQMLAIVEEREAPRGGRRPADGPPPAWRRAKRLGFSDAQLAHLWGRPRPRCARPRGGRRPPDVQDRRHLRGRVRRRDAVPLLDLRGRETRCARPTAARWSSSAPGRTASARASSSTTAACTPASPCATPASRR